MNEICMADIRRLNALYKDFSGEIPEKITPLAGAGSNRRYYRIETGGHTTAGTCGDDIAENRAFISLSRHFSECVSSVPVVLATDAEDKAYIQTWCGSRSLFDCLAQARQSGVYKPSDIAMLESAIQTLADLQYTGGKDLDYNICHPRAAFDRRLVRWDLNYFKYSFLKPSGVEFDENRLQDEFDRLEEYLLKEESGWQTFMHRDFQSRNIMVDDNANLRVIDFQGGRRGPGAYDLASFLWQAKARFPMELKSHLTEVYVDKVVKLAPSFSKDDFRASFPYFVLFRTLQTLGAYGFRGWVERKPHFLQSVPAGVGNLEDIFHDDNLPEAFSCLRTEFPYLGELARILKARYGSAVNGVAGSSPDVIKASQTIKGSENPLTVTVTSFSFKKGIPADASGNGGGFVFDCRAPHNPGRYEIYRHLTGLDKPVQDFLEKDGEIGPFIDACEKLVDASVERYLQRGFTSLAVNFGCTGGQHRSVYSADAVARHINSRYGVRVVVNHREQNISSILPPHDVEVVFDSFLCNPMKKPQ